MTIKIAIEVNETAFLPEAYAYKKELVKRGYSCRLVRKKEFEVEEFDVMILFHGFHPFWRKYPPKVIGEYHSLSVGTFGRLKDLIKRLLNIKCDYYIFLNDDVRQYLWFNANKNFSLRGMGYEPLDTPIFEKRYDVVYCGSYRKGLHNEIRKLASLGLSVAVVGYYHDYRLDNIYVFGRVRPEVAHTIIVSSKYGLNYTPDEFPLNIQDSTKVIEYCGYGLGVISNSYKWLAKFESSRGARFLRIESIHSKEDVYKFDFVIPDIEDLVWPKICNVLFNEIGSMESL